ncbi:MAG: HTH domain-containing protein [Planctomycetes bacterium]|nr:HTH domain-containing protein [Planctomycetota bacterium]
MAVNAVQRALIAAMPKRRQTKDPVSDLAHLCGDWLRALKDKGVVSVGPRPDGTFPTLAEIQTILNGYYRDRFDAASRRVLVNAETAGQLSVWNDLLSDLSYKLRHLQLLEGSWPNHLDLGDPNRWSRHFGNVKDCQYAIDEALAHLRRMGSALQAATNRSRPLPPDSLDIWKLLKGRAFSAAEIAHKLGREEMAIRKAIQRMRSDGRPIENVGKRGYYRTDAPPPDAAPPG